MRVPLKIKILESGHTQRELSVRALIPETQLSAIVRGRTDPTPAERESLARALNCGVDELFRGEAKRP